MKIVALLIPAYLPAPYVGATPTPYQSGTVDKFEKALAALSPDYLTRESSMRLIADSIAGRFVVQKICTRYEFAADPATTVLADAINLALKDFGLASVTARMGDEADEFTADKAEELANGLHHWSAE